MTSETKHNQHYLRFAAMMVLPFIAKEDLWRGAFKRTCSGVHQCRRQRETEGYHRIFDGIFVFLPSIVNTPKP